MVSYSGNDEVHRDIVDFGFAKSPFVLTEDVMALENEIANADSFVWNNPPIDEEIGDIDGDSYTMMAP